MASKKPARSAKKTGKAGAPKKPARAAKKAARTVEAAKAPRAKAALVPADEKTPLAVEMSGAGRTDSIEAGIARLRQRLRFTPPKQRGTRVPAGRRVGQDPEKLDAALKRLSESYRALLLK